MSGMTEAQARAARRLGAEKVSPSEGLHDAVFVYCTQGDCTLRWLIDADGRGVEVTRFRR